MKPRLYFFESEANVAKIYTVKSGLEAHAGFFRLRMKGIFGPYVL